MPITTKIIGQLGGGWKPATWGTTGAPGERYVCWNRGETQVLINYPNGATALGPGKLDVYTAPLTIRSTKVMVVKAP